MVESHSIGKRKKVCMCSHMYANERDGGEGEVCSSWILAEKEVLMENTNRTTKQDGVCL